MTDTRNHADARVLEAMFDAFNRHDADGVVACMTEDFAFEDGKAAHKRAFRKQRPPLAA